MPDADCTWDDLVRGPITFAADQVPDYVLVRANGEPLYTLTNPVDDAAMRVTHVLRGEDLLSSTPRQIALHDALVAMGESPARPRFGHLPYVMGEGNRKLSKRDPESSLQWYRDEGYLPEALLNYLALLGWSMGEDREFFSLDEMAGAFTLERVSPNPARFDLKKATAINGDWIRRIDVADLVERIIPFLVAAGVVTEPVTAEQRAVLDAAVPLVQERMETLRQSVGMLAFLLLPPERFEVDPTDAAAVLTDDARPVIDGVGRGTRGARGLARGADRAGPARGPDRRSRAQAQGRLRPGSRCGHVAVGCRRRCSSRWRSSAASGRWRGCGRLGRRV